MPLLISEPMRIPVPGGKLIDEHVGQVNTPELRLSSSLSVAYMQAPPGWSEPFQAPEFDEITVVVRGEVMVEHDGGTLHVAAGQSVVTHAGERVRYSTGPDGADYVAICTPAFTPQGAHRDDEAQEAQP